MNRLPVCDVCNEPVKLKDGVITVSYSDIHNHQEEAKRYHEEHTEGGVTTLIPGMLPKRVKWLWGHYWCTQEKIPNGYEIEITRFNTLGKALSWTLHLSAKTWYHHTRWEDAVRRFHTVISA